MYIYFNTIYNDLIKKCIGTGKKVGYMDDKETFFITLPKALNSSCHMDSIEFALYRLLYVVSVEYDETKIVNLKKGGVKKRLELSVRGVKDYVDLMARLNKNKRETMIFTLNHIEENKHIYFLN